MRDDTVPGRLASRMVQIHSGALFALALLSTDNLRQGMGVQEACSAPLPEVSTHIDVGGRPVDVVTDRSGCHVFVTVARDTGPSGLLVLQRSPTRIEPVRFIEVEGNPFGMRLSADGSLIYVAAGNGVAVVDVERAIRRGEAPVVGVLRDSSFAGAVMVNLTTDGRLMFVSQERASAVTVIDLSNSGRTAGASPLAGARIVGRIPTGRAPIAVELSQDGRRLYVTSQEAPPWMDLPVECRPQVNRADPPDHRAGAVLVVDVARAAVDPASSVVATLKAGCNPVRLLLSPDGRWIYVSARTDDEVLVFQVATIEREGARAVARIPVGTAPVGLAATPDGRRVFVTSSNRFASSPTDRQDVYVIDGRRAPAGAASLVGSIPAGAFPRQLIVGPDGTTLFVTNYASGTLQLIDLRRARPAQAGRRSAGESSGVPR